MMKKVFSVILVLAFSMFAGCNGGQQGGAQSSQPPAATQTSTPAGSVDFPTRNIEFVVASAAGGGSDLLARALSAEIKLSQPVVVVNRTGAGGTIGTTEAKNAKPDGHTILLGMVGPFETQPHLIDVQYTLDDFRYVSALTYEPLFLAVKADAPWNSIQDLKEAFAEGSGNTLKFGSSSPGSVPHLAQEILYKKMGISAEHVPFDGSNPAVVALLGGHIGAISAHLGEINNYVTSGELKILGMYSSERSDLAPDVPTIKEQGYDIDISAVKFVAVSSAVPDEIVEALRAAIDEAKNTDAFKEFLALNFSASNDMTEEELKAQLTRESEMYKSIVEELGLKNS